MNRIKFHYSDKEYALIETDEGIEAIEKIFCGFKKENPEIKDFFEYLKEKGLKITIVKRVMKKSDCYKCKWRRDLEGDAHSFCVHPSCKDIVENPMLKLVSLLSVSRGCNTPTVTQRDMIKVECNPIGVKRGGCSHPLNFDPIWIIACEGFENK